MSTKQVSRFETSWGPGSVYVSEGRLIAVDLPETRGEVTEETTASDRAEDPMVPQVDRLASQRWVAELEAYFRGERMTWTAEEISLDVLVPEPFAHAVYVALLTVPPGETVAYGELAEMAGYPRAARAVGNVMAANPIPVVIPCHRVIRADGTLGNYGNDPAWKERLLEHERAGESSA